MQLRLLNEMAQGRVATPILERIMPKIAKSKNCWYWTGAKDWDGYGKIRIYVAPHKYAQGSAHREMYKIFVGKIPDGYQVDHLCMNKSCVKPSHLEAVTPQINTLRAPNAPASINARKTHCLKGHKLTTESVYSPPKYPNKRECKICRLERTRLWLHQNRD